MSHLILLELFWASCPGISPSGRLCAGPIPTLATGNVCLLKHASNVPISAFEMEKMYLEAGFPKDTFQTLLIGAQTTERLIEGDRIDGVSLTGSVAAGSKIGSLTGKYLKKVVLELGESHLFIVLEDADLEKAACAAVKSRTNNAVQSCIAAKRMIVMESVAKRFVKLYLDGLNELKVGDPLDEATDIGPLAREEFLAPLKTQLEDAEKKGAKVHRGPKPPDKGFFMQPSVLTNLTPDMLVVREEVFGPVAPVIVVHDEEVAMWVANDTEFGLGVCAWTRDIEKALRLAKTDKLRLCGH